MSTPLQSIPGPHSGPSHPLWPYLTAGLPGCGGRIKTVPEDFMVEELPAYTPSGHGEHLYLWVEKRGLSTTEVMAHLGRVLGLPRKSIGHAGRKDARALTRQWLSLHYPGDPEPDLLETENIRVLGVSRHLNKLRTGHLRGNRFEIRIRDITPSPELPRMLDRLNAEGFPNYFGQQRLGADNHNALQGRRLIRGEFLEHASMDRLRFVTNAYQAVLFNELVATRLTETGRLDRMIAGDLAVLRAHAGFFSVPSEGLEQAQVRADQKEISPSAPLFGYKTPLAEGQAGHWERSLLSGEGLTPDSFRLQSLSLSPKGERRAVRAFTHGLTWATGEWEGLPSLTLQFTLDKGVYATTLLREIMKTDDLGP